jgi:hypothetical protein
VVFQRPLGAGGDVGRGTAPLIGSGVPFQGLQRSAKACSLLGFLDLTLFDQIAHQDRRLLNPEKLSRFRRCGNAGIFIRFKNRLTPVYHSATRKSNEQPMREPKAHGWGWAFGTRLCAPETTETVLACCMILAGAIPPPPRRFVLLDAAGDNERP